LWYRIGRKEPRAFSTVKEGHFRPNWRITDPRRSGSGGLGKNALEVEIEDHIEQNGQGQQGQRKQGKDVDLVADRLEIFKQFLLFEGIAIRGFSDHLQLIFNPLEGRVLVHDLVAKIAMLGVQLCDAILEGLQVDWGLGRRRGRMRREEIGDGSADVPVEQGQEAMHEGKGGAERTEGALQTGGQVDRRILGRRTGESASGECTSRRRGSREAVGIARERRLRPGSNRQRGAHRARTRFICFMDPEARIVQAKILCITHGRPSFSTI